MARRDSDGWSQRDPRVDQLRTPPASIDAEQAVLGGVMLSGAAWDEVADVVTEGDFYRRDHQLIYRAISELAEKKRPFDAVTLGEWFESNGMAEEVAGGAYLIELASTTPSAANVRAYAEIVKDKAVLRKLVDVGTSILNNAYRPDGREAAELVEEAHCSLYVVEDDKQQGGAMNVKDVAKEWFDKLVDRFQNPEKERGILTPWGKLNKVIHSLKPGTLTVLAARPSMGKSATAVNLAVSCSLRKQPKRVHYFDLESTKEALYNRGLASLMRIPLNWLQDPANEPGDYWAQAAAGLAKLNTAGWDIDDTPALSINQIVARARRAHRKEKFDLLVIDHLHLIPLPGKTKESTEIGHITAALKRLAKELGISVLLLSQLNRSVEQRADKRPTMSDLRESGNIEQDADLIIFVYRDDYYAKSEGRSSTAPGLVEFIVAKQREGSTGNAHAKACLEFGLIDDLDDDGFNEAMAEAVSLSNRDVPEKTKGKKQRTDEVPA